AGLRFGAQSRLNRGGSGNIVALDMSGTYLPQPALNVGLYLDGKPLVGGASAGDLTQWGTARVQAPLVVRPAGFGIETVPAPLAHRGESGAAVALNLEGVYAAPFGLQARLDFTPASRPVPATGWDAPQFGAATLTNAAGGIYPPGVDTLRMGSAPFVAFAAFGMPLALDLEGNYAPASAQALQLRWAGDDKNVSPYGITGTAWGAATLTLKAQGVFAQGFAASAFGAAGLRGALRQIEPAGVVATRWGTPLVFSSNRTVAVPGFNAFKGFGVAAVTLGTRRIKASLGVLTAYGKPMVAGGIRWLDQAGRGIAAFTPGRATVWFKDRLLAPRGDTLGGVGKPMVDFNHPVDPVGWDSAAFGRADVYYHRDIIDLAGRGIHGTWGDAWVYNYTQYARTKGVLAVPTEAERFGRDTTVWNLRQYVTQLFEPTPDDGGAFGHYTLVENRNKMLRPDGLAAGRFGVAIARNNARIVTTERYVEFSLWGDALVAYRIRTLYPVGTDTAGLARWAVVYNAARVVAPAGFESWAPGRPDPVWSNLQTVRQRGRDQAEFGQAMVAFRIRTLAPYSLGPPTPPTFGADTQVKLWRRYVAPPGLDAYANGVPTLEIHRTLIFPRAIQPTAALWG
ncbi:MAG: hypothetical protein ACREN3_14330, partial [Gemmatimonadaceae bacterium]